MAMAILYHDWPLVKAGVAVVAAQFTPPSVDLYIVGTSNTELDGKAYKVLPLLAKSTLYCVGKVVVGLVQVVLVTVAGLSVKR